MIIDMHMHTARHSDCSRLSPETMAATALERGIDGIVITDHDYLWPDDEIEALQTQFPSLKILRGIEVSTAQGHALAYGLSPAETTQLYLQMPLAELTQIVHSVDGIVVLAHPTRYDDDIPSEVYHSDIDGVEALSLNVRMYMERAIQSLSSQLDVPCIAGTDAHAADAVGFYGTDFDDPIRTEKDLVAAVKAQAYSVYGNMARIAAYNETVEDQVAEVLRLKQETTLSRDEIKAQYGHSYSFQKGVERGKDLHLRVP